MSKAPFSSVENTFGELSQMDGKSPRKLTVHERDVINGLKQLTEAIFKPHFRHEQLTVPALENSSNDAGTSSATNDASNLFSLVASSVMAKENQANLDGVLDATMKEAEQFCAMVVQQLNTNREIDDWHNGQLQAYSSASQRMFESSAEEQSNAALANVRRKLNEF